MKPKEISYRLYDVEFAQSETEFSEKQKRETLDHLVPPLDAQSLTVEDIAICCTLPDADGLVFYYCRSSK